MFEKILTPILVVIQIVWGLSSFYFLARMGQWFFETDTWYTSALAAGAAFWIMMLPLGSLVVMGLLFYFLAFVEHWHILWAILYICPGALFLVLGTSMELISALFKRNR